MPARNTRGRFTSIQGSPATPTVPRRRQPIATSDDYPSLLKGAQGNIVWKEGEVTQNSVGMTNVAKAAVRILRHLVNAEGALDEEDFQQIKEFVDFIDDDNIEKHLQELLPPQHSTPQGRLMGTFLSQESTETSVQRRLFNLTPTPNQRKKPRLLEELEAESNSDSENLHQVKGKAREQAELPCIIRDQREVDGERIIVRMLQYTAGQTLPFFP
ncbi:hypothetical protein J3E69DRAFT_320602 [Trichoderma sp. SZMC 28015]